MLRWVGAPALLLGVWTIGWPSEEWSAASRHFALGAGAVTAWGLASDTVRTTPHTPHRRGAWVMRLLWFVVVCTIPFTSYYPTVTRWCCGLLAFAMSFSFIARLHRQAENEKFAAANFSFSA